LTFLYAGHTDEGLTMEEEAVRRLFSLDGREIKEKNPQMSQMDAVNKKNPSLIQLVTD